jgi:excisionase family DNA binding protein
MNQFNRYQGFQPGHHHDPEPLTYTRNQAAKRANISVSHLDRKVKLGHLKPIRDGRKVLFPKEQFDHWCINRNTTDLGRGQA